MAERNLAGGPPNEGHEEQDPFGNPSNDASDMLQIPLEIGSGLPELMNTNTRGSGTIDTTNQQVPQGYFVNIQYGAMIGMGGGPVIGNPAGLQNSVSTTVMAGVPNQSGSAIPMGGHPHMEQWPGNERQPEVPGNDNAIHYQPQVQIAMQGMRPPGPMGVTGPGGPTVAAGNPSVSGNNIPVLQQLLKTLKNPSTPQQQDEVLRLLRSNPQVKAALIKRQKQQQLQRQHQERQRQQQELQRQQHLPEMNAAMNQHGPPPLGIAQAGQGASGTACELAPQEFLPEATASAPTHGEQNRLNLASREVTQRPAPGGTTPLRLAGPSASELGPPAPNTVPRPVVPNLVPGLVTQSLGRTIPATVHEGQTSRGLVMREPAAPAARGMVSHPQNSSPPDIPLQFQCVICMNKEVSVVFLPCRHMVICDRCDEQLKRVSPICPSCRAPINRRLHVFHP